MPVNPKRPLPGPRRAPGSTVGAEEVPAGLDGPNASSRDINIVLMVGVAILLLGFLLPWVSFEIRDSQGPSREAYLGVSMAIELKSYFGTMSGMYSTMKGEQAQVAAGAFHLAKVAASWLYLAYAIPLLCGAAVTDEVLGARSGRNGWYFRAGAALSPLIAFVGVAIGFGKIGKALALLAPAGEMSSGSAKPVGLFDVLDIGAYLCVAGMFIVIVSIMASPKPRQRGARSS